MSLVHLRKSVARAKIESREIGYSEFNRKLGESY